MTLHQILFKSTVTTDLNNVNPQQKGELLKKLQVTLMNPANHSDLVKKISPEIYVCRLGNSWRVLFTKTKDSILVLRIARREDLYE